MFSFDPWMHEILSQILTYNYDLFIDVKANIGQTLCKVKMANPNLDYIGFEPNTVCNYSNKKKS